MIGMLSGWRIGRIFAKEEDWASKVELVPLFLMDW
jgi:hypothetical protein